MIAPSERVWGNPDKCPEIVQLFLGVFYKGTKGMKEHNFYPMVNKTIRSLMLLAKEQTEKNYIFLILSKYPHDRIRELNDNIHPLYLALLTELDRQYARWDKGEKNGK